MIKLKSINTMKVLPDGTRKVDANLFADTKTEVTDSITGADVDGLLSTDIIDFGSFVSTASAEFAYMQSSGQWKWGE